MPGRDSNPRPLDRESDTLPTAPRRHLVKLTGPLIDAILAAMETRFARYSERSELIVASVTLPQFRLRWLDDAKKDEARSLLYQYAITMQQQTVHMAQYSDTVSDSASQEDDFCCVDAQPAASIDARTEVDMYLTDTSRDMQSLHRYPVIKKLFLQYNTALPSSAPVERLFSLGGQILTPRRNRLTPRHFERQLLLRANKWLIHK